MSTQALGVANIIREAAEWVVRLSADEVASSEHEAFRRWQAADPRHAEAVASMSALIGEVEFLRADSGSTVARAALRAGLGARQKRSKKIAAVAAAVLCCFLASWLGLSSYPPSYLMADIRTGIGEWHSHQLPDGTSITLSGSSAVNVHYAKHERRLSLVQGEVLVEVARDPERAFLVETEHGSIRALGTRFVVRREAGKTQLLMLESSTAVQSDMQRKAASPANTVVVEGQGVNITVSGVSPIETVDVRSVADAWRFHQLVVHDRPLAEVLDELSRYRRGYISYAPEDIATLRVSAVLPLDDTDKALQLLQSTLPIQLSTTTRWMVNVRLRADE